MSSFNRIKGYIEPVLWVASTVLLLYSVFKFGAFWGELERKIDTINRVDGFAKQIISTQAELKASVTANTEAINRINKHYGNLYNKIESMRPSDG